MAIQRNIVGKYYSKEMKLEGMEDENIIKFSITWLFFKVENIIVCDIWDETTPSLFHWSISPSTSQEDPVRLRIFPLVLFSWIIFPFQIKTLKD